MLSITQVRKLIKTRRHRYFKKLLKVRLSERPENCVHNKEVRLNSKALKDIPHEAIRVCTFSLDGDFTRDYDTCMTVEEAKSCSAFTCRFSKEVLKKSFQDMLKNPEFCAKNFPDLFVLHQVMEESVDDEVDEVEVSTEPKSVDIKLESPSQKLTVLNDLPKKQLG